MLFNSQQFLVFLPAVFLVCWAAHRLPLRLQNLLILLASWYFYARWDARFLGLLAGTSAADWLLGLAIGRARALRSKRAWLGLSLALNLGVLGIFKYFDFFADSFAALLSSAGFAAHPPTLRVILPVGISFYTFQSLGYTLDVYRGTTRPVRDPVAFLAYVAFFPQLVAGPIERSTTLLPQFLAPRTFDAAAAHDGLRQMLWGYVKKVVVADNLAPHVAAAFDGAGSLDAPSLWAGVFLFAIQIYGDFSGYSDIAVGTARLFGFRLMANFRTPYFAGDIGEFWRRWHISLTSWFRDYVYVPLGGSRRGPVRRAANAMATFLVSGLWHGANWTFVAWGGLHGLGYLVRTAWKGAIPALVAWPLTFVFVLAAWVLFRAPDLGTALSYWRGMAGMGGHVHLVPLGPLALAAGLMAAEFPHRSRAHALEIAGWPGPLRWSVYYVLVAVLFLAGNFQHVPFIYFQF